MLMLDEGGLKHNDLESSQGSSMFQTQRSALARDSATECRDASRIPSIVGHAPMWASG